MQFRCVKASPVGQHIKMQVDPKFNQEVRRARIELEQLAHSWKLVVDLEDIHNLYVWVDERCASVQDEERMLATLLDGRR